MTAVAILKRVISAYQSTPKKTVANIDCVFPRQRASLALAMISFNAPPSRAIIS